MKTSTLSKADLNRAVAMALGLKIYRLVHPTRGNVLWLLSTTDTHPNWFETRSIPDYAGDIALAWPIIKEKRIALIPAPRHWNDESAEYVNGSSWRSMQQTSARTCAKGYDLHDPQIAALRAFVASVYGDEVELP